MNINPDALSQAHQLAVNSGKVELKRLARALALIPSIVKTFTGTYTDGSHMDEYWIPGSQRTGYSITVRNHKLIGGCQCKDYRDNRVKYCKHMAAVSLIVRAQELTPAIEVKPVIVLVVDPTYRSRMVAALWPESD